MRYCTKCVMPDTRPDLRFDDDGVCDACRSFERKHVVIDWDAKQREFEQLLEKYGNKNPAKYDCVIPVSGGKDSHVTLHLAKQVYGLNPLCVCFEPTLPTEIGRLTALTPDAMTCVGVHCGNTVLFPTTPNVFSDQ